MEGTMHSAMGFVEVDDSLHWARSWLLLLLPFFGLLVNFLPPRQVLASWLKRKYSVTCKINRKIAKEVS